MQNNHFSLDIFGVDIQSYLLVREGLKPVLRTSLLRNDKGELDRICRRDGISVESAVFNKMNVGGSHKIVFLSRDPSDIRRALEAEKRDDIIELGKLLGYPECCISAFQNRRYNIGTDYVRSAYLKCQEMSPFCNNVYNYQSKINNYSLPLFKRYSDILSKSAMNFFIIHMPCSLDCDRSEVIGRKTHSLLKREFPGIAKRIMNSVSRPILYFNHFSWIGFDGKSSRDNIFYRSIIPANPFLNAPLVRELELGDQLRLSEEGIEILSSGEVVSEFPVCEKSVPLILGFDG